MKRRTFIRSATTALGTVLIGDTILQAGNLIDFKKIKKFGIQLYTLRADMPKDSAGILTQLASYGYKQIESYDGSKGMFWGMGPLEFKKRIEDLGMKLVSSHCDIKKDFEKKVDEACEAGMTYLICPWVGTQKTADDYKKIAADFNSKAEYCVNHGLHFAYHNHDYSFRLTENAFGQEILLRNTDPKLVDFQMDIYWVVVAGQDPETWLRRYPGRFTSCHVKDRSKNPGTDNGKNSVNLGTGTIDFHKVLKTASRHGMEYYFVEQEFYPDGTPLEAAKSGAEYMKRLKA